MYEFPPFRLDPDNACLWRHRGRADDDRISLTPKAFEVLRYLVEHAGRLVTQEELLEAVWPETYIKPEVLKSRVYELRSALGDRPKIPRYIETVPRRGYRFIAVIHAGVAVEPVVLAPVGSSPLVGRGGELGVLQACLQRALDHQRQVVFITGEAGIGKTALVDAFEQQAVAEGSGLRIARGQCLESYGGTEAYYPMLEALGQLWRGSDGDEVVQTLETHAPTWLVQFPALVTREHRETLQRELQGATRERMLREIAEALEVLTAERPLLLIFEDLQWVDPATVDLLAALARRRGPAQLLLVATYRPVDLAFWQHPLKGLTQDLLVHQLCQEMTLEPLSETDVAAYLAAASSGASLPEDLAGLIYRQTEGNPLFMRAVLDHLTQQSFICREAEGWSLRVPMEDIQFGVPESLRLMIDAQIEHLEPEARRMLEVASVAGMVFTASVIASTTHLEPDAVEALCETLVRRQHLVRAARAHSFPDGSICQGYEFAHALYREVCYWRQASGRRATRHRQLGQRLEALFAARLNDVASELAYHFEAGADWARAIRYLRQVAATAERRYAHREAADVLRHALALVSNLPETERTAIEIDILEKLAMIYVVSYDTRAIETYEALAARAADTGLLDIEVRALLGLVYPLARVSVPQCLDVVERVLRLSAGQDDSLLRARTRMRCFFLRLWAGGWNAQDADACEQAFAEICVADDHRARAAHLLDYSFVQRWASAYREAQRNTVESLAMLAKGETEPPFLNTTYWQSHTVIPWGLWFLGEWGEALREIKMAVTMLEKNGDERAAQMLGLFQAWVHLHAMDFAGVRAICESVFAWLGEPSAISTLRICRVLAGAAETGLGHYASAREYLLTVQHDMDHQMVIRDWYWRMPLEWALTDLWLAQDDLAQARPQAEQFLQVTLATAERTWQALAWDANARVALATHDLAHAHACIAQALSTMEGFEVPMAAWHVHATAAALYELTGNSVLADSHRTLSRATILQLAHSLPVEEPLRATFLSAPAVRLVLGDGRPIVASAAGASPGGMA
jgi:DNA-binding winged helix-turn-helix (wHTH) protein